MWPSSFANCAPNSRPNEVADYRNTRHLADKNKQFILDINKVGEYFENNFLASHLHFHISLPFFSFFYVLNPLLYKSRTLITLFNSFPNKPRFLRVCSTSLLKTLWEREKLLVTSNFSFSHSVFYPFWDLSTIFIKVEKSFILEASKMCRLGKC